MWFTNHSLVVHEKRTYSFTLLCLIFQSKVLTLKLIPIFQPCLFHGRTRTAYLYRCVWSGITGR